MASHTLAHRNRAAAALVPMALLAVAATPTAAMTAPVDTGPAPVALSTTTIELAESGHFLLDIPANAIIDARDDDEASLAANSIRFSEGDTPVVVTLTPVGGDWTDVAKFIRLPMVEGGEPLNQLVRTLPGCLSDCLLPAGTYHVAVLAEAEFSLTLTFDGLPPGTAVIDETTVDLGPVDGALLSADIVRDYSTSTLATTGNYYAAAWDTTIPVDDVMIFSALWWYGGTDDLGTGGPAVDAGRWARCTYGGGAYERSLVMQPGCPGGNLRVPSFGLIRVVPERGSWVLTFGSSAPIAAGDVAAGGYTAHTGVSEPGFFGFWIDPFTD
jgi:hypothetical protein